MALITCPDCGREFSETASVCPQCGYKKRTQEIKKKTGNGLKRTGLVILMIVITCIVQGILMSILGDSYPKALRLPVTIGVLGIVFAIVKSAGWWGKKDEN